MSINKKPKFSGNNSFLRKPIDKVKVPKGEVHIIESRCKGCKFCAEYCPKDVLEMSTKFNQKGYHPPYVKNPGDCVNCDFCEMICPEYAIFSVQAEQTEAGKNQVNS